MKSITLCFICILYISTIILFVHSTEICDESGVCRQDVAAPATTTEPETPTSTEPTTTTTTSTGPQIAIIGAGIGGSSTAHYLKKLVPEADITVYDKENRVCGRVLHFHVEGKKVEIGASIYHTINHNVAGFVKEFNLTQRQPFRNDSSMGIWDGKEFVHWQSDIPLIGNYIDIAKLFWRYGTAPYYFKNVVDSMLASWEALYDLVEPFTTTDELFRLINLQNFTETTAPEYLEAQGVARSFSKELLGALTRVNYNTDVAKMNAFAVGVSAVGSGNDLFSVGEGNKFLCEKLLESAKAHTLLETPVTSVKKSKASPKKYEVNGKEYDVVVIAAPLELANIDLADLGVDAYVFNAREFQEVHVTFVAANQLSPAYFKHTEKVPETVLTIEEPSIPFSSASRQGNIHVADGRPVFKVSFHLF